MPGMQRQLFSFTLNGYPEDTFFVWQFKGREGLSRLFSFQVTLLYNKSDQKTKVDTEKAIHAQATFTIHGEKGDIPFPGVVTSWKVLPRAGKQNMFVVTLMPKLERLEKNRANRLYLDKDLKTYVADALKQGGLSKGDFEFRLKETYDKRSYVCQYNESDFDFVSRWFEREGVYYFFEPGTGKLIATDSSISHKEQAHQSTLTYAPDMGTERGFLEQCVQQLRVVHRPAPAKVRVQEWNYRTPRGALTAEHAVGEKEKLQGKGEHRFYGDHFQTKAQGERLAKVRAQEFACKATRYKGASFSPYLRPGYTFKLEKYFIQKCNQSCLVVSVNHEGAQERMGESSDSHGDNRRGKRKGGRDEHGSYYSNTFTAIPASTQFRPERKTETPRFHGMMHAHVDAASSGEYAELDEQGRYKVVLPFDLSGKKDGQASAWMRMAQPYAGDGHGMHFPLHKGTEVMVTCVDGDPDRPIIAGAAPNPNFPSQVDSKIPSMAKITTAGGNKIHIEDKDASQRILLHTPAQNSFIRVGEPNDPPGLVHDANNPLGITICSNKSLSVKTGCWNSVIMGNSSTSVGGFYMKNVAGTNTKLILGEELAILLGTGNLLGKLHPLNTDMHKGKNQLKEKEAKIAEQETQIMQKKGEIAEQVTTVAEEKLELAKQKARLQADIIRLTREKQRLADEKFQVVEQSTTLVKNCKTLAEQKKKTAESIIKICKTTTDVCESISETSEDVVEICQDINSIAEESTVVCGEIIRMGGTIDTVAEDVVIM